MQVAARFVELQAGLLGRRYMVEYAPNAPLATVVFVHAWAEEMNKSRRMVAEQARRLAGAGLRVLQADLLGCGDSAGDFSDANWDAWLDDVLAVCRLATDERPLWLWGLRGGCLVAVAAAQRLARPFNLLLWQPQTRGTQVVQQFLRLKAAGEMLGGGAKGVVERLRAELECGRSVDIAGYVLSPALAGGVESSHLSSPPAGTRVEWIEVTSDSEAAFSHASQMTHQAWRAAGVRLRTQLVAGPAFWQTTEIEDAPNLWQATTAAVTADAPVEHDTVGTA